MADSKTNASVQSPIAVQVPYALTPGTDAEGKIQHMPLAPVTTFVVPADTNAQPAKIEAEKTAKVNAYRDKDGNVTFLASEVLAVFSSPIDAPSKEKERLNAAEVAGLTDAYIASIKDIGGVINNINPPALPQGIKPLSLQPTGDGMLRAEVEQALPYMRKSELKNYIHHRIVEADKNNDGLIPAEEMKGFCAKLGNLSYNMKRDFVPLTSGLPQDFLNDLIENQNANLGVPQEAVANQLLHAIADKPQVPGMEEVIKFTLRGEVSKLSNPTTRVLQPFNTSSDNFAVPNISAPGFNQPKTLTQQIKDAVKAADFDRNGSISEAEWVLLGNNIEHVDVKGSLDIKPTPINPLQNLPGFNRKF